MSNFTRRSYLRSSASDNMKLVGMIALAVLFLGAVVGGVSLSYMNAQTQTCTVTEKDRTRDSEGKSDMRVYTDECGVMRVQDMFFAGEWNSADLFSKIKEGQTYEMKTTGFRVGIVSSFPTIREISLVEG